MEAGWQPVARAAQRLLSFPDDLGEGTGRLAVDIRCPHTMPWKAESHPVDTDVDLAISGLDPVWVVGKK